ncbi:MAG: DUF4382 domain-containing protein [Longimicrobiales bacterium]
MQARGFAGNRRKTPIIALAALLAAAACDSDGTGPVTSHVQVLLTDAPHEELDSALVWISRVYLQGGGGLEPDTLDADTTSAGGRVDLFNDAAHPLKFDLLKLRDGITAELTGLVEVDEGPYQGLRLVVDSARVYLVEGLAFEDGSRSGTLKVPSGYTSGIKVKLADVIPAEEGDTTAVTVDFDVDQNFVIQRNPQTGAVKQILFTPVLREKSREESGS